MTHAEKWSFDFEDNAQLDQWPVVDEDSKNLGGPGPPTGTSAIGGFDGKGLRQTSNIWGGPADEQLMGTFLLFMGETLRHFTFEVDVSALDNDGMGVVWAWDTDRGLEIHNRVMMCNNAWPDVPLDDNQGPMIIFHKRISNETPWYGLMEVEHPLQYDPYPTNGVPVRWTLRVSNGSYLFEASAGNFLEGDAPDYTEGLVGLQLYAQDNIVFDDITIEPISAAVDARGKAATV